MSLNVCISGANRGLGLGLCIHYLKAGCQVIALARSAQSNPELNKLAEQYGSKLILLKGDVSSKESLTALQELLKKQSLDLLINNAGVMLDSQEGFLKLSLESLRQSFEVNVFGAVSLSQLALPALQRSSKPQLVMISSLMGSIAENSSGAYYAYRSSKAAMNMIMRSLAHDHAWLRTISLHPGWVQTDMGGTKAPTTLAESVQGMTQVIAKLESHDSGKFFDFKGREIPW